MTIGGEVCNFYWKTLAKHTGEISSHDLSSGLCMCGPSTCTRQSPRRCVKHDYAS